MNPAGAPICRTIGEGPSASAVCVFGKTSATSSDRQFKQSPPREHDGRFSHKRISNLNHCNVLLDVLHCCSVRSKHWRRVGEPSTDPEFTGQWLTAVSSLWTVHSATTTKSTEYSRRGVVCLLRDGAYSNDHCSEIVNYLSTISRSKYENEFPSVCCWPILFEPEIFWTFESLLMNIFGEIIANLWIILFHTCMMSNCGIMRIKVNLLFSIDSHVNSLLEVVMGSLKLLNRF